MTVGMDYCGPVKVTGGKYKGLVGYYDDDHTEKTAIVYFGIPFLSDYVLIQRRYLEACEGTTEGLETLEQDYPQLVEQMGVVTRKSA